MSNETQPTILVIIGISGDLSRRKLLPAIREIAQAGVLPEKFKLVGITRRELKIEDVLPAKEGILRELLQIHHMDMHSVDDYHQLNELLTTIETEFGEETQRLFYLSVPPQVSGSVIEMLGESGLAGMPRTKVLLEKPFGVDLCTAEELVTSLNRYFSEEQIYRIDHYMAKEMAQNLIVFRSSNALFKHTWNKEFIDKIEIVNSETIGIEGRAAFYEQTGALRDVVQSHLLQLTALILMDLPEGDNWQLVPQKRLEALEKLIPPTSTEQLVRGQYKGYREEVQNPNSSVETYVSLQVFSEDPKWEGVPITITAGKVLNRKATEIHVQYHPEDCFEANILTFRIQPDEGVQICLWTKKPGFDRELQQVPLTYSYDNHFEMNLPEAYERVFVDAMRSDHTLFTTSQEVLASWRVLEPVQKAWEDNTSQLQFYEPGVNRFLEKE